MLVLLVITVLLIRALWFLCGTDNKDYPDFLDAEDLGELLCKWCPLEEHMQGTRGTNGGYHSCEGCRCIDAYANYIEEIIDENRA